MSAVAFANILNAPAYRLLDARVPVDLAPGLGLVGDAEGIAAAELAIERGRITRLGPPGSTGLDSLPGVDLRGGLVLPRLVDGHTHLDKGHIARRAPNPAGTFLGARAAVMADRTARWSAEDVRARMDFALRCAFANGTGAIRTHIDSLAPQADISWPVFAETRSAWRGRIALQAVALFPVDIAVDDPVQFGRLVDLVQRHGGVLGGLTHLGAPPDAKLDLALDRVVSAAAERGLDLDFHVDESGAPEARSLGRIAEAAIRHRFAGRIVAGHCCSLAVMEEEELTRTMARVREAGIAIMSLPMCNLYLQDRRAGRTPRWRGVAPLQELDRAGIPTMVASDNTRDPFYAYGDLDMLEVFRESTRILHLDHTDRSWTRLLGVTTAAVMGFEGAGTIAVGAPADLVLLNARDLGELVTRPQSDRVVLVEGRPIDTALPDYRELDALYG